MSRLDRLYGEIRRSRDEAAAAVPTAATTLHTFLADDAGAVRLFDYSSVAFCIAEHHRPQLRADGWFPYLVQRPGGWSIGLARSEAEAVRRNELK